MKPMQDVLPGCSFTFTTSAGASTWLLLQHEEVAPALDENCRGLSDKWIEKNTQFYHL
jgi:hypothetical protein